MSKDKILFELDEQEYQKFNEWRGQLPSIDFGTIGGGYRFVFIPTGIGTIKKVIRDDGYVLDLTDYGTW